VSFEGAADFLPRHSRKFQIQYHHTGDFLSKAFESGHAVRCNLHSQSIRFEQALERALHWSAVFYD
jgi:hypothetical protein